MLYGSNSIGLIARRILCAGVVLLGALAVSRDFSLINSSVLSRAGVAVADPEPVPLTISLPDSTYVVYPDEIDLRYAWVKGALETRFNEGKLRVELAMLAGMVRKPPVEPLLNLKDMSVYEGSPGIELDVEATLNSCKSVLARATYDELAPAVLIRTPAAAANGSLAGFDKKAIGEYTTRFPKWQMNRNYNIGLCASFFNGRVLMPGEELSFNATTGDRTYSTGYKSAPVIENQELVPGVGGGSCQVSTTLYNAACLEAGLAVVERWPHALHVHYIGNNRDATVAFPGRDLKFINTYTEPLLITSEVGQDTITFRVFTKSGARNGITPEQVEMTNRQKEKTAPPPKPKPKPEVKEPPKDAGSDVKPAPPAVAPPDETPPPDDNKEPPSVPPPPPKDNTPPPDDGGRED